MLDKVYEEGELFWDTADAYMDNEDLIGWHLPSHLLAHAPTDSPPPGQWFKKNPGAREKIFLASKFALTIDADGNRGLRSDPEYVHEACAKSLRRLGVDHIDLYYCHRLDGKTPVEKTVEAMKQLKHEGKIKHIGLSECSSDSLRRASKIAHIDAIQIEYSYVHA